MQPKLLIVDAEPLAYVPLCDRLLGAGYVIEQATTAAEARHLLAGGTGEKSKPDLVFLDCDLPHADGLQLLKELRASHPDALVIAFSAHITVDGAIQAIKSGAYHYLDKATCHEQVALLVDKALAATRGRRASRAHSPREAPPYSFDHLIGDSPAMRSVKNLLRKVLASPASTVLITGESGTGKDLVAKILHFSSHRSASPFMNITCSALPESLLESELFGYERGAFTDAKQRKKGLLELAEGGTVFLDEVAELSPALQAKLLRFLEDKTFKRVGGAADISVDARIIAATNRDLHQRTAKGLFREDLLYRLFVLPVHMPPLRQRQADINLIIMHFIGTFSQEFGKNIGISPQARQLLNHYPWPGNVRELRNAIERAMLLCDGDTLNHDDFAFLAAQPGKDNAFYLPAEGLVFAELERAMVEQALARAGGNQTRAAALLGMNRDQIRYRIEKFSLGNAATGNVSG